MDTTLERDRLRQFIDLILSSLDEDIDGKGIASRGCLSSYHFDRLVSAALRESPGAFRRRRLLERAAWELGRTQASVRRVALSTGFQSVEGFTRAFSRTFGITPGRYRGNPAGFHVDAPNGVHFHPPGGLSIPGPHERNKRMDVVDRLLGHDLWFTSRLLDRAGELPADALDREVLRNAPRLFGSGELTLRDILDAMVSNKESWTAAVTGNPVPDHRGQSLEELKSRLATHGQEFQRLGRDIRDKGSWDAGFVDALCDPPETFSYGGMLAHVLTFSPYRRNLANLAFRELGVEDLGTGDPVEWERSLS